MTFQDAAQGLSEAVHQFVIATVRELEGKQSETEAIETARGALHKVADAAADAELEQAAFYEQVVQFMQKSEGEQP